MKAFGWSCGQLVAAMLEADKHKQCFSLSALCASMCEDLSLSSSFPFVMGEVLPATFSPPHLL